MPSQTERTMALSSSLALSIEPSILILSEVRMTAKSVAVNDTVPSGLSGMFMATRRYVVIITRGCGGLLLVRLDRQSTTLLVYDRYFFL